MNGHAVLGPASDLERLRGAGLWLIVMGVALIIVGFLAIGSAFIATVTAMLMVGILLIVGAFAQIFAGISTRQWRGFFLHPLSGVLYFVAGILILEIPIEAALALTLLIAAYLLVGGIFRIIFALIERFHSWGWVLLSGVISALLGLAIWRQWPLSGLWVIGLFVGIEMLFSGISWLMLGMAVRSASRPQSPTPAV